MTHAANEVESAREHTDRDAEGIRHAITRIRETAERTPASIDAHHELFRLYTQVKQDNALPDRGQLLDAIAEATVGLPALTLHDCTYKLALWWHAHAADVMARPSPPDHVAASLLQDLVQITGAHDAVAPSSSIGGDAEAE